MRRSACRESSAGGTECRSSFRPDRSSFALRQPSLPVRPASARHSLYSAEGPIVLGPVTESWTRQMNEASPDRDSWVGTQSAGGLLREMFARQPAPHTSSFRVRIPPSLGDDGAWPVGLDAVGTTHGGADSTHTAQQPSESGGAQQPPSGLSGWIASIRPLFDQLASFFRFGEPTDLAVVAPQLPHAPGRPGTDLAPGRMRPERNTLRESHSPQTWSRLRQSRLRVPTAAVKL